MDLSALLAVGGPTSENLSIFDPVSPPAESIRSLSVLVLAICAAILLVVEFILLYAVFRFRHTTPASDTTEPPQVYGSFPIEIAWTAAPTLVVFMLAMVLTRTLWEVNVDPNKPPPDAHPLRVTVIGHQWWWEYVYESFDGKELGFITANELHVPASDFQTPNQRRPVYLTLQSADVAHSYWVPRLAGKTDLIPGRSNHMWFETEKTGLYLGQCAEYCGTQHAGMLLRVQVDSLDVFTRWLADQAKPAVDDPSVHAGRKLMRDQSCVNCHRVRGLSVIGTYAPDLTHLMSRETIAAGILPNTPENLHRWVADPQAIKSGCLMPAFGLSEKDVDLLVGYLATLR